MPLPSQAKPGAVNLDAALAAAVQTVRENIGTFGSDYPDDTTVNGTYGPRLRDGLPDGANVGWTTGFWPGQLWLAAEHTGDDEFVQAGLAHVEPFLDRIERRSDTGTHDLGFLYQLSCVVPADREGDARAARAGVAAADALMERYLPAPGIVQAWGSLNDPDQRGRTIIDSLMNMPLLHWASRVTGDDRYAHAAIAHVTQLSEHIFREDGSTFHTFYWDADTGAPLRGGTEQGSADESCWARGQAWGIYGFALNHRLTGRPEFLAAALRCAEYLVARLRDDWVPAWDLSESSDADTLPDSSAAAITAAGLLEIASVSDRHEHLAETAHHIMASLVENYAPAPEDASNTLLLHGVYDMPKNVGIDEGTLWGDYFYLETLVRMHDPLRVPYW